MFFPLRERIKQFAIKLNGQIRFYSSFYHFGIDIYIKKFTVNLVKARTKV